jgi:hypothetical protein
MELTKYAKAIKAQLAEELKKKGSTLEELEATLQNINTGEGVYKMAFLTTDMLKSVGKAVPDVIDTGFKSSITGGALAGLSMDEMDKSVESVNKALEHEREKINLVRRITENLKREHGLT